MKASRSSKFLCAAAAVLGIAAAGADAQNYPARPVTLYVGFPAGSASNSSSSTATVPPA